MAQLPPKIPNMTPSWSDFSHHPQKLPSSLASFAPNNNTTNVAASAGSANPSWVDEFLDFSTARRGSHRRSVSDSITFLEAPMLEECRGNGGAPAGQPPMSSGGVNNNEFDRFDEEQFLSMFNDEISIAVAPTLSSSNPSTPSDHNSINDEKETQNDNEHQKNHHQQQQHQLKNESEEVDSQCDSETQAGNNATTTNTYNDRIVDPKRVKR